VRALQHSAAQPAQHTPLLPPTPLLLLLLPLLLAGLLLLLLQLLLLLWLCRLLLPLLLLPNRLLLPLLQCGRLALLAAARGCAKNPTAFSLLPNQSVAATAALRAAHTFRMAQQGAKHLNARREGCFSSGCGCSAASSYSCEPARRNSYRSGQSAATGWAGSVAHFHAVA